jgi:hypothetical protein
MPFSSVSGCRFILPKNCLFTDAYRCCSVQSQSQPCSLIFQEIFEGKKRAEFTLYTAVSFLVIDTVGKIVGNISWALNRRRQKGGKINFDSLLSRKRQTLTAWLFLVLTNRFQYGGGKKVTKKASAF